MKIIRKLDGISHVILIGALFLAVGAIILVHYNEYKNITKNVVHTETTDDLDKKVTALKLGVQQMIINQRAYVMLGKEKYRKNFMSYYGMLDGNIIDVSKNTTTDESDKLIKDINSKVSELKVVLKDAVEEKDKGLTTRFTNKAYNERMLDLYDSATDDLEQLSWIIWSQRQEDLKNTKEAYSSYSSLILVSSLLSLMIFGSLGAMLIFSRHKTERTQDELTDVNQRLNILLQSTSDGILDWDLKENKLVISPKFKTLLGYEEGEIRSDFDSVMDLIHPEDRLSTWLYARKVITPEQPVFNQIFRMKHKDSSWAWISAKGIGFFDKDNELERFVGVHTDVTLQKNLEDILKYSKDKAETEGQQKSDFLAYMSHEIRSPMSAVIGLARILSETSPLTDEQRKYIDALKNGADTIYGLLNNILDVSKLNAHAVRLEKVEFNMQQALANTISLSAFRAREKNIKLNYNIASELQTSFVGDPHRIRQIVANLVGNAVKFTDSGGTVDLNIKLHSQLDNERVKIEIVVTDSGIGIPKDRLEKIFDPYEQSNPDTSRKYGGTGLGLSICKQFTELMGGKIEVESEEGKGARFRAIIPLLRADGARTADETVASNQNQKPKLHSVVTKKMKKTKSTSERKVLVVEDYAPNAMIAEAVIEGLGYKCTSVDRAKEAILLLSSKAGKDIDIVLMDVQLPDMSGFEATKLIRKMEEDNGQTRRRIIAVTAHDLIGDREKCLKSGMDDYISKPFNHEELSEKLKQQPKIKAAV